jgi:hypothetical protein
MSPYHDYDSGQNVGIVAADRLAGKGCKRGYVGTPGFRDRAAKQTRKQQQGIDSERDALSGIMDRIAGKD